MSHGVKLNIDLEKIAREEPIQVSCTVTKVLWLFVLIGIATIGLGLVYSDWERVWGVYYVNLLFWMGLACGGVMTSVIVQIVRAKWAPPIRRIGESNISFLIWAYFLLLGTYFVRDYLFPWGDAPMPGREWWMQPLFVYSRFGVLFAVLFGLFFVYVRNSLRSDIGYLREHGPVDSHWKSEHYNMLALGWKGSESEITKIQVFLSRLAPVLVVLYAVIYSLFAFEMVMGMDRVWYSNMFGGFYFVGNIYMGWVSIVLLTLFLMRKNEGFRSTLSGQQFWDLGKLMFGFCMLWGYLFFSQYLPQWYGNLPEETAWLLTRVRGPWAPLSFTVLGLCFVMPFVWLISEDIKRSPKPLAFVGVIILIGMWLEKYVTIIPQRSPEFIPFLHDCFCLEVGVTIGFLGVYLLSVFSFLRKYPFLPVSHPLTRGSLDW